MTLFSLSGLLIAITSLFLGFLVFLKNRKEKINQIWLFFSFCVALWGLGGYEIGKTTDPTMAFLWWRIAHSGIIFIPIFFLHFVYEFLNIKKKLILIFAYLSGLFLLFANLSSTLFIANLKWVFNSFYWDSPPTPLYILFVVLWFSLIGYAHYKLLKAFYKEPSGMKRFQIQYFFLATVLGFSGGATAFLPVFNINLYPILNFTVPFYPIIMSYAILRYRLMNIKVIATEITTIAIVLFALIQTVISQSVAELIPRLIFLIIFIIFGILLIRSVNEEVKRREEIQKLADSLAKTTDELTAANARLKELDQFKNDFISIASHQMKTPLTSIKGLLSMVLEGFWAKKPDEEKEELAKIYASTQQLINLVDTLLNISRMESGRMAFNFEMADLEQIIKNVINDLMPLIKAKKLEITFTSELLPKIFVDALTIRQVIMNLIDNAIKYTLEGNIALELKKENDKIIFKVTDTGIGFSEGQSKMFFEKFYRTMDGAKANAKGSGVGLYAASEIIKAHHGQIGAESQGIDKGSVFWFTLPIK